LFFREKNDYYPESLTKEFLLKLKTTEIERIRKECLVTQLLLFMQTGMFMVELQCRLSNAFAGITLFNHIPSDLTKPVS